MKSNKGYLFFTLVVLFGIVFNVIQMNGIKTSSDDLSLINHLEKTSSEKVISEASNLPTIAVEASPADPLPEELLAEPLKEWTVDSEQETEVYGVDDEYDQSMSEPLVPQLSAKEQLRINFQQELNQKGTTARKYKEFIIASVFEREPDALWSGEAETLLTQLMTELAVEYGFETDLGKVKCSDVMCFVSLRKVHKLPHMVYNFKIMRDGDFGSFNFFNGGKSRKGIYIRRFKTIYRSFKPNQ